MKSCPMTTDNVAEYNLTDKQIAAFCNKGCSVDCEELFLKAFGKEVKIDD